MQRAQATEAEGSSATPRPAPSFVPAGYASDGARPSARTPFPLVAPPLSGERTYIHSADIFDRLLDITGADADIVARFRARTHCAVELCPPESGGDAADVIGSLHYRRAGEPVGHLLRRRADHPVTTRVADRHDAIIADAAFGDGTAFLPASPAPFGARAVALFLELLFRDSPGDTWLLAELACYRRPAPGAPLFLRIVSRVGGRFWKAAAEVDGQPIGHVILSRAPRSDTNGSTRAPSPSSL